MSELSGSEIGPLPRLPKRPAASHKGTFGRALLVGGSVGMTGAIGLAGRAALRGGAGLVQLAVPACCQSIVASYEPSYMTVALDDDGEGRIALSALEDLESVARVATALGVGPGLGRSEGLVELVGAVYTRFSQPAVFDADGLNALAAQPELLAKAGGPRILTPHPGEFRGLIATSERFTREELEGRARELAGRLDVVVVLKGHHTYITDGHSTAVNNTGNPGMATGGTGDVLTGLIVALLCQGLTPFDAARLGVHLHGLAGDLAAETLGEVSLMATDLVDYLPRAFRALSVG